MQQTIDTTKSKIFNSIAIIVLTLLISAYFFYGLLILSFLSCTQFYQFDAQANIPIASIFTLYFLALVWKNWSQLTSFRNYSRFFVFNFVYINFLFLLYVYILNPLFKLLNIFQYHGGSDCGYGYFIDDFFSYFTPYSLLAMVILFFAITVFGFIGTDHSHTTSSIALKEFIKEIWKTNKKINIVFVALLIILVLVYQYIRIDSIRIRVDENEYRYVKDVWGNVYFPGSSYGLYFVEDQENIPYGEIKLSGMDASKAEVIAIDSRNAYFIKDDDQVFYLWYELEDANPETFQVQLGSLAYAIYSSDGKNYYYQNIKIDDNLYDDLAYKPEEFQLGIAVAERERIRKGILDSIKEQKVKYHSQRSIPARIEVVNYTGTESTDVSFKYNDPEVDGWSHHLYPSAKTGEDRFVGQEGETWFDVVVEQFDSEDKCIGLENKQTEETQLLMCYYNKTGRLGIRLENPEEKMYFVELK